MRRPFEVVLAVSTGLILAFLLLPILALFLRIPPEDLLSQLTSEVAVDALVVSVKTSVIAHAVVLLLGTPTAYLVATRRFRGRSLVLTLIELPLVLPPAVAGIALFAAFGRAGLLGDTLDAAGISIPFTQTAVVFAIIFVSSPFYIRLGIAAFEALDPALIDASRTLGAGPGERSSEWLSPSPPAGSPRPRRSHSHVGSASSVRRSCSPAACRA